MPKTIDLTDRRFDRLVAKYPIKGNTLDNPKPRRVWFCICDCGNTLKTLSCNLLSGKTRSCGCYRVDYYKRRSSLLNEKFGHLKVIEELPPDPKSGRVRWKCICKCGQEIITYRRSLIRGTKTDCGCVKKIFPRLSIKNAVTNDQYSMYSNNSTIKGRQFRLSKVLFESIIYSNCHYCGVEPSRKVFLKHRNEGAIMVNGIDRKDNNKGYVPDNVVTCCTTCNYMKVDMDYDVFIDVIKRISNHLGLINN